MIYIRSGNRLALSTLLAAMAISMVAALTPLKLAADDIASPDTFHLFLVRHAEKQASKDDPELSGSGALRAAALAHMLKDAGVQAAWSSDYRRTRQTALPLAQAEDIELRLYDPRQLESFAQQLLDARETALVIGHSNTTPELSLLLGGEAFGEIDEQSEYDRLYVLTVSGAQVVSSTLLRYSAK